jgi:hypothetical protein
MTLLHELFGKPRVSYVGPAHPWDELMGVELELENVRDNRSTPDKLAAILRHWTIHSDHSLRNGLEYVTSLPVGGEAMNIAIRSFYMAELEYTHGPRTSTHIHINMTDVEPSVLQTMFILMYTIEDPLFSVVEETRKWAGYCMPLCEMHESRIRKILNPRNPRMFMQGIAPSRNQERYYGFNTNMARHGTVEFRYFPGGPSETELRSWVDLVVAVKKFGRRWTPESLIAAVHSPDALAYWLLNDLGEWGQRLLNAGNRDQLYQKFVEVAAMYDDEQRPELGGNLVYITDHYLEFVIKKFFSDRAEAKDYLVSMMGTQRIFGYNDWESYLNRTKELRDNNYRVNRDYQDSVTQAIRATSASLRNRIRPSTFAVDPDMPVEVDSEEENETAPSFYSDDDDDEEF